MLEKQVHVVSVKTMADKTIRVTVDLLNGNSDDFKSAFEFINTEAVMVLADAEAYQDAQGEE